MKKTRILEQSGVPAQIKHIKELNQRIIIDPEDAVVNIASHFRIIVQCLLELLRPIAHIILWVVALPSQVWPGVFQLKQLGTPGQPYIQHGISVRGHQTSSILLVLCQLTCCQSNKHIAVVYSLKHALKVFFLIEAVVRAIDWYTLWDPIGQGLSTMKKMLKLMC